MTIRVELYSRPGCHLCDEMKAVLERARLGLDVQLSEVDISQDPELQTRYGWDIPLLFVNGHKAFKYRATENEMRRRLLRET